METTLDRDHPKTGSVSHRDTVDLHLNFQYQKRFRAVSVTQKMGNDLGGQYKYLLCVVYTRRRQFYHPPGGFMMMTARCLLSFLSDVGAPGLSWL